MAVVKLAVEEKPVNHVVVGFLNLELADFLQVLICYSILLESVVCLGTVTDAL